MGNLKENIDRVIGCKKLVNTPAYFVNKLFDDIIDENTNGINDFSKQYTSINNVNSVLNNGISKINSKLSSNITNINNTITEYENQLNQIEQDFNVKTGEINNDLNDAYSILNIENPYKDIPVNYIDFKTSGTQVLSSNFDISNIKRMWVNDIECVPSITPDVTVSSTIKNVRIEFVEELTSLSHLFEDTSLISLDLSNLDTSKVADMSSMFRECSILTSLGVSNFDTSNVTDMSCMFYHCNSLTSLGVSNFDTSNVTNMSSMFCGCSGLTSLDVSNFDTSKVTDMNYMFGGCSNLTSLDLYNFDTSNVIDMHGMFTGCYKLTSLDLSRFNTSNVTDMSWVFNQCLELTSLNVSNWDTSKVTDMNRMFYNCELTSLDLSNFDTSQVTDMSEMFRLCSRLTSLDLSHFITSNVTDMSYMFYDCWGLTSLDLSNWNTSNVTNFINIFSYLQNIDINISGWDISNFEDIGCGHYQDEPQFNMPGTMFNSSSINTLNLSNLNFSNPNSKGKPYQGSTSLTYSPDYKIYGLCSYEIPTATKINNLIISGWDLSQDDNTTNNSFSHLFEYASNISNIKVSNIKINSMNQTFANSAFETIDLSECDFSDLTLLTNTFYGCDVDKLIFPNYNIDTLTVIFRAFERMYTNELDLSNFDFSNVTNTQYAFDDFNGNYIKFPENMCDISLWGSNIKRIDCSECNQFEINLYGFNGDIVDISKQILSDYFPTSVKRIKIGLLNAPIINVDESTSTTTDGKIFVPVGATGYDSNGWDILLQKGFEIIEDPTINPIIISDQNEQ